MVMQWFTQCILDTSKPAAMYFGIYALQIGRIRHREHRQSPPHLKAANPQAHSAWGKPSIHGLQYPYNDIRCLLMALYDQKCKP
jgi:hypothetical protein